MTVELQNRLEFCSCYRFNPGSEAACRRVMLNGRNNVDVLMGSSIHVLRYDRMRSANENVVFIIFRRRFFSKDGGGGLVATSADRSR